MAKTFFFNLEQLYRFRVTNRLSMDQLAAELGISRSALQRLESGISDPSCDTLANLMWLYSVDGSVEFDRIFNHLSFGDPEPPKYELPLLGPARRPT